jgi:hypothetical protein
MRKPIYIVEIKNEDTKEDGYYAFESGEKAKVFFDEVNDIIDNQGLNNIEVDYITSITEDEDTEEILDLARSAVFMLQSEE